MFIQFIDNGEAASNTRIDVPNDSTVGSVFALKKPDRSVEDFTFRVNSITVSTTVSLSPNDRLSITPAKIVGA